AARAARDRRAPPLREPLPQGDRRDPRVRRGDREVDAPPGVHQPEARPRRRRGLARARGAEAARQGQGQARTRRRVHMSGTPQETAPPPAPPPPSGDDDADVADAFVHAEDDESLGSSVVDLGGACPLEPELPLLLYEGELEASERERLEAHVKKCARCEG